RSDPSKWTCSSAFGSFLINSFVNGIYPPYCRDKACLVSDCEIYSNQCFDYYLKIGIVPNQAGLLTA
ncbi:MAG: hypothetical protein K8S56_09990, partial [Candidatus Cloacimonetes bacterium]|nr:hypothetical protein [Candidatus Cloacimonadota bacterium]